MLCVAAQRHLGTVSQLLLGVEDFFLSFRNHRSSTSIARPQPLARLHVSNHTIWISQAPVWQEWQCLHRGSLARAVNLIGSYYHQVSLCRSHPAGLHQVGHSSHFFVDFFQKGIFSSPPLLTQSQTWPDPATSSILMQSLQPDRSNFAVAGFRSPKQQGTLPVGPLTLSASTELWLFPAKILN